MKHLDFQPTAAEMDRGIDQLAENVYPGRVAIMGVSLKGDLAIQAYALMGRSDNSRDRKLVQGHTVENEIRAVAASKTAEEMAKVRDAELIYYTAMHSKEAVHVVSNGAQTDPVLASMWLMGHDLETALRNAPDVPRGPDESGEPQPDVKLSWYEPDAPNFTPRITGVLNLTAGVEDTFSLGVVRKPAHGTEPIYDVYGATRRDLADGYGVGYGVQTYLGDGDPLPSFNQEPFTFPMGMDHIEVASNLWDTLNVANRVAVVARGIDLVGGFETQTVAISSQA